MRYRTLKEKIEFARMAGHVEDFRLYACLQIAADSLGISEEAILAIYENDWLDERKLIKECENDIDWPEEFDEEEEE